MQVNIEGIDLGPGDPTCSRCDDPDPHGLQRAIVAFGCIGRGRKSGNATVVYATPHLICDFAEGGIDAGDVWGSATDDPDNGIQVWEGRIVYTTTPSTPNGPAEFDVDYDGDWREPTEAEWTAIRNGRDPWKLASQEVLP